MKSGIMSQDILVNRCGVCEGPGLELLWDLPKFPLTEKYGIFDQNHQLYKDQQLVICEECGHVQLKIQIAPELLYSPHEYSFRTSQSITAKQGTEFFYNFYQQIKREWHFHSMLDIGGNDLYLAQMTPVPEKWVIDPVCSDSDPVQTGGVKVLGKFIEDIDFQKENLCPDLIFCRHVLEHVPRPKGLLQKLFKECNPNALYVFEIPCFENLKEANRFDAIFHQHYHYFDLISFQRLLFESGGTYVSHTYNRQGSCGGALLIAFCKTTSKEIQNIPIDVPERKWIIQQAISNYILQAKLISTQLQSLSGNIYGYGASLMLATLGYHLQTDFSQFVCILDDDQLKSGGGYKNIPVKISSPSGLEIPANSNFMITSLENVRPIFKRILQYSPRRILLPIIT
jgi:hypothetical protein